MECEPPYDPLSAALIDVPGVEVRVLERCTSTNSVLLSEKSAARILLAAEEQTAGRGRRGRRWDSTAGADVTFSLSCPVRRPPRELASLSLVAAVAAVNGLRTLGVGALSVKWPNDLLAGGAKLGGILVETRSEGGAARAVFGFGINCQHRPGLE
ncbi:MAG: biotin--[acetyl-CoA-carboxylase] ligase, partial [Burkholderiales bacterium]